MEQILKPPPLSNKANICKSICLLLVAIFLSFKNNGQKILINDSAYVFSNYLNPDQQIQHISPGELPFKKYKERNINLGLTGSEFYFIILKISATKSTSNQYLTIDNTSLDTISIYRLHENSPDLLLYRGGQLVPFNDSSKYAWHTVPLQISSSPSFYCIAVKSFQKNINIHYKIISQNELMQFYLANERIIFFYIGIAFMISAVILLAFFLFKKPVFAAYFAYIICISAWIISHYGRIYPYLYPNAPLLNNVVKPMTSLGAGLFLLIVLQLVFAQNLKSKTFLSESIRWVKFALLITISIMPLLLFPHLNERFMASLYMLWHIELLMLMGLVIFIPFHFFKETNIAKIFSAAMLVICMMTSFQLFSNAGILHNYFLNEHGMSLAILVENSIMAFGLFYGLLEERKMKELQVLTLESEQMSTLKKLITLQEQERKRIAGDLHDNIGPLLAALKINFRRLISAKEEQKQMELVEKTENIIDDSITEIRNIAHNLMPKCLSAKGLINTLDDYFENMEQLYSKKIFFKHDVQSVFEPELQMNVYRITSELVLNAAKHSEGQEICVSIESKKQILSVNIRDNGQGFNLKHNGNKNSLGIQSAESRVHYLKGKFRLQSQPGAGSTVNIEIPL
ncbi:MAG: sensor histidine kinase [Ginsengibacter sp.]